MTQEQKRKHAYLDLKAGVDKEVVRRKYGLKRTSIGGLVSAVRRHSNGKNYYAEVSVPVEAKKPTLMERLDTLETRLDAVYLRSNTLVDLAQRIAQEIGLES